MFDQQMAGQEPFRQAGVTGQNRLMEYLGLGGNAGAEGYGRYGRDFGMSDFQADPGYESDGEREKLKNDRQSTDGERAMVCLLQTVSVPDQAVNLFVFISA
jgi:hypothetical protein